MSDLLRSQVDRRLEHVGDRTYSIPAPPTRAALAVESVHQRVARDEDKEEDHRLLRRVCSDWLPLRPFSILFSDAFTDKKRREVLRAFVWAGAPAPVQERFEKRVDREQGEAESVRGETGRSGYWWRRIAEYRSQFGATFEEAMGVPWTVMLGHLVHLPMLRAREIKDAADAHVMVRSEDGDEAYEKVAERAAGPGANAGGSQEESDVKTAWEKEGISKEKWRHRKMMKAREIKQNSDFRGQNDL